MADEGTESIGGVSIKVSGNFSDADAAFEAAVSRYVAQGQTLAQAIQSALAEVSTAAAQAAQSVAGVGAAAQSAAPGLGAMAAAAQEAASASAALGGAASGAVPQIQAAAAAAESGGGSFRGVVYELRLFRSAFLAIMLPEMIGRMIESLVEFAQKNRESLDTAILSWREYNGALEASNTALALTNAKLENQIAKIEGQPQNNLKVALLEIAEAGQKMSVELDRDFDALYKHLNDAKVGANELWDVLKNVAKAMGGDVGAGLLGGAEAKQAAFGLSVGDLQSKLKAIEAAEGGFTDAAHQLTMLRHEADQVQDALTKLYTLAAPTELTKRQIADLEGALSHLKLQMQDVGESSKKAALEAQLGWDKAQDDFKFIPRQFGEITGAMNDAQIAAAVLVRQLAEQHKEMESAAEGVSRYQTALAAGTTILQKSGESVADWMQRVKEAKVAADQFAQGIGPELGEGARTMDQTIKEGTTDLKDWSNILKTIPNDAQDAGQQIKAFNAAIRDLHLRDTNEQLVKMAQDMQALAAGPGTQLGGTTVADMTEGWIKYGRALAAAGVDSDQLSTRLQAGLFTEIPQAFSTIEGQLTNMLFNWKNWGQQVINIFKSIGEEGVHILLKALLEPLEQQLEVSIAQLLAKVGIHAAAKAPTDAAASAAAAAGDKAVGTAAAAATPQIAAMNAAQTNLDAALTASVPASAKAAAGIAGVGIAASTATPQIAAMTASVIALTAALWAAFAAAVALDIATGGGALAGGGGGTPSVTSALSFPSHAEGTDYVPRTGLAMLHEGERVVTRQENEELRMQERANRANAHHGLLLHMHRALEGIENVPHAMPVILDPGERVLTKESNAVFSKMLDASSASVPAMSAHTYQNSSHVDHIDMRGATLFGMTKEALTDTIMNVAVKRGRRVNVAW